MFINDLLDDLRRAGHSVTGMGERYVGFKTYPLLDYLTLVEQAAVKLHPSVPTREGVRRLGRSVYPRFVETLVGKTMFAIAGNRFDDIIPLASKAYSVSITPGSVTIRDKRPGFALVEFRNFWSLPDSLQVGNFEGAMQVTNTTGEVKVRTLSPCDVDFEVTWQR